MAIRLPNKHFHLDTLKTWLAPLGAFITAIAAVITVIVAVHSIHHQAQLEEVNRKQEHEKWEANFAAQIQLAETNRQRDFAIWQQQRSEEQAQQLLTLQQQQKKQNLSEKERLYYDFVYDSTRMFRMMSSVAWDNWVVACWCGFEIKSKNAEHSEFQFTGNFIKENTMLWEGRAEKDKRDLDEQEATITRLMQSIAFSFSPLLLKHIGVALVELSRFQVGIPTSPKIYEMIKKTLQTDTNAWHTLIDYYDRMYIKSGNAEQLEKSWELVDKMMFREIMLSREGTEITAENLTNSAPITLRDGRILQFFKDDANKIKFGLNLDTKETQKTELKPAEAQ